MWHIISSHYEVRWKCKLKPHLCTFNTGDLAPFLSLSLYQVKGILLPISVAGLRLTTCTLTPDHVSFIRGQSPFSVFHAYTGPLTAMGVSAQSHGNT